jgi:acyl-[acyl-carrier-protein]-phospholipid O-acyltransferase / long-chain-fatty-acid--[acyl-carrier-protein] ligase
VIEAAKIHGIRRVAVEDPVTGPLSYKRLSIGATILGRKLMRYTSEGKSVGVMLPNTTGAVVTIVRLISAGRVPAMINFTAGSTNILTACRAADLGTIVTSRTFIDKGNLGPLVEQLARQVSIVYLEDGNRSGSPTNCVAASRPRRRS